MNQNTRTQKRPEKKKIEPVNLVKVSDDFATAIINLCEVHDCIKNFFYVEDEPITEPVNGIIASLNYIDANTPDLINKLNIHTTLSLGSNRATIKTENGFSFGWYINYTIKGNAASIDNVHSNVSVLNGNKALIDKLLDNGWEIDTKKYK